MHKLILQDMISIVIEEDLLDVESHRMKKESTFQKADNNVMHTISLVEGKGARFLKKSNFFRKI